MTPEGWEAVNLGGISIKVTDGSHQPVPATDQGEVPFLYVSCVRDGKIVWQNAKYISRATFSEISRGREPMPGVVLYTAVGSYGHAAFVREPVAFAFQRHIAYILADETRVGPEYLAQWLNSPSTREHADMVAVGNAQKTVTLGKLKEFPLALPPLPEQRKIAAILSSVDDAIDKTQAVIDQLALVKKAMMQELLTKGLPGRHTRFKQTDIGMVPEEWEVVPLEAVADVAYGLTVNAERRGAPDRRPYLTVANLQDDRFDLAQVKDIGVLPGDVQRYALRGGDLLLVEGNANIQRLGRAAVWRGQLAEALHQNHLMRVRPKDPSLSPDWLAICLNGESGRNQIEAHAKTSSGLHTINSRVVAELVVPLPDIEERKAINDCLAGIDAQLAADRAVLEAQRLLKAAIMSVLLTGEVRVTPDAGAA